MDFTYIKQLEKIIRKYKFKDLPVWYKLLCAGWISIIEFKSILGINQKLSNSHVSHRDTQLFLELLKGLSNIQKCQTHLKYFVHVS